MTPEFARWLFYDAPILIRALAIGCCMTPFIGVYALVVWLWGKLAGACDDEKKTLVPEIVQTAHALESAPDPFFIWGIQ